MTLIALITLAGLAAEPALTTGPVEAVGEGFQFTEGPVWMPGLGLLFSDIPADTIFKADKSEWRKPSGQSNGLTLDAQGRLLAAEHANRRVSRTEADATVITLVDKYDGKRLNSPNDLVVRSDGTVFFTDPPYGLKGGLKGPEAELDFAGVYAVLPDGTLKVLIKDFKKPNGITLSPDEKTLYVADTEGDHIRAFDLAPDAAVSNGRVLAEVTGPDGMKTDTQGNLWCAASDGIRIVSPAGQNLGTVPVPVQPTNCAFGDDDAQTLYITARNAVFKVRTAVPGLRPGPKPSQP